MNEEIIGVAYQPPNDGERIEAAMEQARANEYKTEKEQNGRGMQKNTGTIDDNKYI